MPLLPGILEGLDRASLLAGFALGVVIAVGIGQTMRWAAWTWGMVKRPFLAQREVREINEEAWTTFRSGSTVGCRRTFFYVLVALLSGWLIYGAYQVSIP